jgi:regulator of sirC expression with transglutaminase-like and TPR domain
MSMTREEIQALIQLLDDPSAEVNQTVTKNLLDQGTEILPDLEAAWEGTMDTDYQDKLINLIQEIQMNSTYAMLRKWISDGTSDLLEGVYIIARFQYPELQMEDLEKPLDRIARDVWLELNNNLTALEKIRILNHIFFEVNSFGRNTKDFYSPRNSFINQVLETRKGNPISLAVIYSILAQRLGLPVFGVNLPKNFILAYLDELVTGNDFGDTTETILFYINPYNKGDVLGRKEIDYFLKQQGIKPQPSHYQPCKNLDIIIRILHNIINAYHKSGYRAKAEQFEGILVMITGGGMSQE